MTLVRKEFRMPTLGRVFIALCLIFTTFPAQAQTTTGTVLGRVTDQQGAAVPGVVVQAVSPDTGFVRESTSDQDGTYRLAALPVGPYDVSAELPGFRKFSRTMTINIAQTIPLDIVLSVGGVSETVNVTAAAAPLVSTRSSSLGEVVDLERIENLPLNGRQFANLAATVPGVGLGFHSDATKSSQYTPQMSGGNGRNVNYVIDGGDNTDDTAGGLLQQFPLESIQEFNVLTQRFDAEYGRSNGGVINVATKSGTNRLAGSWFTLVRDDALNATTYREDTTPGAEKQPYERYQFGGSFGGPIVRDRVHYHAAYERTQQDTKQIVDTLGLFPAENGIFDVPVRQNLFSARVTATPRANHYLSLRYSSDRNSQPFGAGANNTRSSWTTSTNSFDSLNVNHNWVLGHTSLNEFVFQYSDFVNDIPISTPGISYRFGNRVNSGANRGAPQRTEQTKWQVRNDYSTAVTGFWGLAHELRGGVNWVHEPRLYLKTAQGINGTYSISTLDLNGPVTDVTFIGGRPEVNFELDMYGLYAQDNLRVGNRLTLNLGVRWDYVDGFPIDQSTSANFLAMQAAGRTGRFAGTLLEDFGQDPRPDKDNIQPRLGAVIDLRGDGRDVIRGGWGLYTDFGYISSNVITAAFDAAGAGPVFLAQNTQGLKKADGTPFRITDPLETIAYLNIIPAGVPPPAGEVVSPLLEQPYTRQSTIGWAHQLNGTTAFTADYVKVEGRDLNLRLRPNALIGPGQRLLAGIPISPANRNFRTALSKGRSDYDALILSLRRRMSAGLDLTASYTLAESLSDVGSASDEIVADLLQEVRDPFSAVQLAPSSRTDSRHNVTITAIVRAPWDISIAPIVFYRSALPTHTFEGTDLNGDGANNDKTAQRYVYTGINDAGVATFTTEGTCETVNCSRRAPFSQVNLRVSRGFKVANARIEAIAEVFNLFNAKNPFLAATQNRTSTTTQFMQPSAYAGDVGQGEQRVGQLGFRVTF
jgi:outer membrane receptor protein involved in Fe transport